MIDALLSTIAPHYCSGCQEIGTLLCDNCKYDIIDQSCYQCLLCLAPSRNGICNYHLMPYQKAWFVGERKGTLQRLIGAYKFQNTKAASKKLAELLDTVLPDIPSNTVVIPIPTSPSHIRERGYDHIRLIAHQLASTRKLTVNSHLLTRNNTKSQHSANRADRIRQAVSAFRINHPTQKSLNYLIIDDVVTTGSTIQAASRLLARYGAENIWVAAIARQPLD